MESPDLNPGEGTKIFRFMFFLLLRYFRFYANFAFFIVFVLDIYKIK